MGLCLRSGSKTLIAAFLCLVLSFFSAAPSLLVHVDFAFAETSEIDAEPDAEQQLVEESSRAYDEAVSRVSDLEQLIEENESRISELESMLPAQKEQGEAALCELYKMQRSEASLLDLVLSSESFGDFVSRVDFLDRVYDSHYEELAALNAMYDELDGKRAELDSALADAQGERERASAALAEAQAARERAQAEARARAEEEARALAEEQLKQEQEQEAQVDEESSDGSDSSSSGGEAVVPPSDDGADWSSDKVEFVNAWADRIDAYLAGSPMSGCGKAFAEAAWNYGVDPRFSPAISCVESSKGAACFLPYNAWGWGSVSWGSWEEAIDAHVRGLARGYGYTLSEDAAKKYCPPNWQHWYSRVGQEMNLI